MNKFVFVDRDGTLICEPEDERIDSFEKFKLVEGVLSGLKRLIQNGYKLVIVTNQDGLGSAECSREIFDKLQRHLEELALSEQITFEKMLICPHFSEQKCKCRKPNPNLVLDFLKEIDWQWDPSESYVVGDRLTDVEMANNLGIKGFLLSPQNNWAKIAAEIVDKPRRKTIKRETKETSIELALNIDGEGYGKIDTGILFFDHLLEQLARHGKFDLVISAKGDLAVDDHHLIEDVALVLGKAFLDSLGDKRGIERYSFLLPMDESLVEMSLDLSGRFHLSFEAPFQREKVGELAVEMIPHFFKSLCEALKANLFVKIKGENHHHMIEASFKALGKCLGQACRKHGELLPSTKGVL